MTEFTAYNLIVLFAMVTMAYFSMLAFAALWHLSAALDAANRAVLAYWPAIGSTEFGEHFRNISPADPAFRILGPLFLASAKDQTRDDEKLWTRLEAEQLSPTLARASGLAAAAPCLGLLFTALSITLGLSGGGEIGVVAERLVAALPSAFLSTVAAMAITVGLTVQIARTAENWYSLRRSLGGVYDELERRSRMAARDSSPQLRTAK